MGVLVEIQTPSGQAWGLLTLATIEQPEWQVRINEVPRVSEFAYGDLVAVDGHGATATNGLRGFLRVLERGPYAPSICVSHTLDAGAAEAWLAELEAAGWETREEEGGKVWLAAPANIDAQAVLARYSFVVSSGARRDARR